MHLLGLQPEPLDAAAQELGGLASVADVKAFDEMIPLGRHTTPEEIARAVLYLASDSGAMVNSQQFSIDGGLSAM